MPEKTVVILDEKTPELFEAALNLINNKGWKKDESVPYNPYGTETIRFLHLIKYSEEEEHQMALAGGKDLNKPFVIDSISMKVDTISDRKDGAETDYQKLIKKGYREGYKTSTTVVMELWSTGDYIEDFVKRFSKENEIDAELLRQQLDFAVKTGSGVESTLTMKPAEEAPEPTPEPEPEEPTDEELQKPKNIIVTENDMMCPTCGCKLPFPPVPKGCLNCGQVLQNPGKKPVETVSFTNAASGEPVLEVEVTEEEGDEEFPGPLDNEADEETEVHPEDEPESGEKTPEEDYASMRQDLGCNLCTLKCMDTKVSELYTFVLERGLSKCPEYKQSKW